MEDHDFVLFLGDTAVRNAVMVAERVRQTIAASRFVLGEQPVAITASCAVAEWRSNETAGQWTGRMQQLLNSMIAAGGNQCCVEDESGPRTVPVSPYTVPTREICIAV
jgi:PleD family two-component response regulator